MDASYSSIPPWLLNAIAPLLDQSPDGIHVIDYIGNLIYANQTFLHMLGITSADRVPRHVSEWDPQWVNDDLPVLVARTIEDGHPILTQHRRLDGSIYDAAISVSTISHEGQSYLFCTVRDVTEQRRLEAALREREEQYRLLVEDLKEVIFRTDAEGRWIFLNPAWREITGFDVDTSLGQIFLEYVYPDDRQRNIDLFQPLIERKKAHCRHEIRYLHRNGGFIWVDVSARLTLDAQGNATGTAGTLTDVTERKLAQDALYESEARFRTIFFEDRSVKLLIDPLTGQIVDANQAATDFYGYPYDRLFHMKIQEINQLSKEEIEREMRNAMERRKNYFNFRHRLASGEVRDVEVYSNTLKIKGKAYLLSFIHDVTDGHRAETERKQIEAELRLANAHLHVQMEELRNLQLQMREQTFRDPLTNLYNRRYLDETLPREIARGRRLNYQLAILMIDIDHFKQINDTYGHVAGDETLRSIAVLIQSRLRTSDIVCRYGGEEIICVLIDTNLENAIIRAEGIRLAIASERIIQAHPDARVTISTGVAMWTRVSSSITAVIQAADMALYRAKLSGRNRVRISPDEYNG